MKALTTEILKRPVFVGREEQAEDRSLPGSVYDTGGIRVLTHLSTLTEQAASRNLRTVGDGDTSGVVHRLQLVSRPGGEAAHVWGWKYMGNLCTVFSILSA